MFNMESSLSLKHIAKLLHLATANSNDVYWLASPDGNHIHYLSPAFEKIWGYTRESFYEKPELWLQCLMPETDCECQTFFKNPTLAAYETSYRIRSADHTVRWIREHAYPIYDSEGQCYAIMGMAMDITEDKKREQILSEAKRQAEAANKAKSNFLTTISHELRTPLASIIGLAQLLHMEYVLPEQREQAEDIINISEHLLNLVDNLLDIVSLESGKIKLDYTPVDLKALLKEIANIVTFQAQAKGIEVLVQYEDDAPHLIMANIQALQHIVFNLVSNALKFTRQGYVLIRVRCSGQTTEQARFVISVEDTGCGINQDKLRRIQEGLQHKHSHNYQRYYGGTGLGLSIAKAYVDALEGLLSIQSEVGKGATVSCELVFPLQMAAKKTTPWDFYKTKINLLIVNDDVHQGESIASILACARVQVVASNQAIIALSHAQRSGQPFDIVWVDEAIALISAAQLSETIQQKITVNQPLLLCAGRREQSELSTPPYFFVYLNYTLPAKILLFELAQAWDKWQGMHAVIESAPFPATTKLKILLVEDDPIVRKVHEAMLNKANCEVVIATDGKQALALWDSSYDVIFMDVGLPEISGLEITKEIRRREAKDHHTPIIALTGYAYDEDRANCLAAGCDEIATKPIKFEKLLQILQRWRQME